MKRSPRENAECIKLLAKGRDLRMRGKPKDAIKVFQDILKRWPDDPLPHIKIGEIYLEEGSLSEAEAEFEAAVSGVGKYFAEPWYGLAKIYEKQGKSDDAKKALKIAEAALPLGK